MDKLFSTSGRVNRSRFFWRTLGIGGALEMLSLIVVATMDDLGLALVAYLVFAAITVVFCFLQTAKRLHDLDRSGADSWLLLVPGYNIYLALQLLLKKGTEGENAYGQDPLSIRPPESEPMWLAVASLMWIFLFTFVGMLVGKTTVGLLMGTAWGFVTGVGLAMTVGEVGESKAAMLR